MYWSSGNLKIFKILKIICYVVVCENVKMYGYFISRSNS